MRGQAGIEGMVLFAIIGIVVTFAVVSFASRSAEIDRLNVHLEADRICSSAKSSINQAALNGPGSRNEMDAPGGVLSYPYVATVYGPDRKVVVSWSNSSVACPILTADVTNSTHDVFVLKYGRNVFSNAGGVVVAS